MATTKPVTSPVGPLEWVTISGEGKESLSGKFQYLANIVLEAKPAEAFKAELDKFWADNKPKGAKKPKSMGYYPHTIPVLDDEGNPAKDEDDVTIREETGKTTFVFKTGVAYADGTTKVVKIFNAKGKEVSLGAKQIGNDSIGRIKGAAGIYMMKSKTGAITSAGVTLYLNGIQLKKFIEYDGGVSFDQMEGVGEDDFDGIDGDGGFDEIDNTTSTSESTSDKNEPEL